MNKNIHKCITNCALWKGEKSKMQMYPLQLIEVSDQPFNKIAIDLITDLNVSKSENQHILIIINHFTGWPEAFLIPDKKVVTIVHIFINNYLPVHMCPRYVLCDNGTEFKNQLMHDILQQPCIDQIISAPYHP